MEINDKKVIMKTNQENSILRIGIFLGGASSEKEISLESGRHVYNSLDEEKYLRIPIFVDHQNRLWKIDEGLLWMNTCDDIESGLGDSGVRIFYEDLADMIDFAFLAVHGKYSEDCFPGLLHLFDIPNNSAGVLGGSIGMDKYFLKKILKAAGLRIPKSMGIEKGKWNKETLRTIEKEIGYPCIVKPSREGCSMGLTKVTDKNQFNRAFDEAFVYDNLILAEEYIQGMEITTTVLGGDNPHSLPPTETPYKQDYLTVEEKFLPGNATMITPPRLPFEAIEKIKQDCLTAYEAMGLKSMTRIDGIWKDGIFYILEPNTPPGMTPSTCVFHQAAEEGMTATDLFDLIIQTELQHKNEKYL